MLTKEVPEDDTLIHAAYLREQALALKPMPEEEVADTAPMEILEIVELEELEAVETAEADVAPFDIKAVESTETDVVPFDIGAVETAEANVAPIVPEAVETVEATEADEVLIEPEAVETVEAIEVDEVLIEPDEIEADDAYAAEQESVPETADIAETLHIADARDTEQDDISAYMPQEEASEAECAKNAPALMGLLDQAYTAMEGEDWQSACTAFQSALPMAEEPHYIQRIKLELLNMLMRTERKREAVDLVFDILGADYPLNSAETSTLVDVLQELQKGV